MACRYNNSQGDNTVVSICFQLLHLDHAMTTTHFKLINVSGVLSQIKDLLKYYLFKWVTISICMNPLFLQKKIKSNLSWSHLVTEIDPHGKKDGEVHPRQEHCR